MGDSVLGVHNSLQVFFCNRSAKNRRLKQLESQSLSDLYKDSLVLGLEVPLIDSDPVQLNKTIHRAAIDLC